MYKKKKKSLSSRLKPNNIITMNNNISEGKQHRLVMEYLKQIVKDKLEKKNTERIKQLDLLYSKALTGIEAINVDITSDEDIDRLKNDLNGNGTA